LNILLINYEYPPLGGGAGNATREIGRAMTRNGHNVTVITSKTTDCCGTHWDNDIKIYRIRSLRRRNEQSNILEMATFVLMALMSAKEIARKEKINAVVVFFTLPVGPVGLYLKRALNLPYIVSLRGGDVPGLVPELRLIHKLFQKLRRKVLENAMCVIANSQELADLSMRSDSTTVVVIKNGVDSDFYSPLTTNMCTAVGQIVVRLLVVARIQKQKDLPRILRILSKLTKQTEVKFVLRVAGDGPDRIRSERLVEQLGLQEQIEWLGWLNKEELRSHYQQADCLLNFSHYEGLPNVVLEAMSSELLVLLSDIAPHRELVDDGVSGLLLPVEDDELAFNRLAQILGNWVRSAGYLNIRRNARKEMVDHYRWSDVANKYLLRISGN